MPTQQQISRAMDDIFTTTWYDRRASITDQVFLITPFFDMMFKAGKIKERVPEGTHWEIPIRLAKLNQNNTYFDRGDQIGSQERQSLTTLQYEVRNFASGIVRYWVDDRKNRGKAKIINYLDEKLNNTRDSMVDQLETDLFTQNSDPKAINALSTLIANDPTTGTVGGLSRASEPLLRNQTDDFSGDSFATDFISAMTTMFNNCSRYKAGGRRAPNIIITTQAVYEAYEELARQLQQIVTQTSDRVSLGFGNLAFKGVELYWCPECPADRMYFLNTDHLEITYDPVVWMEMTEWKPITGNSLDKTAQIVASLNLCADNFLKQGVIHSIDTTS